MRLRRPVALVWGALALAAACALTAGASAAPPHWRICNSGCPGVRGPAFSPDGAWIAFGEAPTTPGGGGLFLVRPGGGGLRKLPRTLPYPPWHVAWSPDGSAIAFDTNYGIALIRKDGTGLMQLATYGQPEPSDMYQNAVWAPDGLRIAFEHVYWPRGVPPTVDVQVMNRDGTNKLKLADDASSPAWSPDGRLAFTSGTSLYTIQPDGSDRKQIADLGGSVDGASWSPDGRRIAVAAAASNGSARQISVVDAVNGNVSRLTTIPHGTSAPAWSPSGRRLAFIAYRVDGSAELRVMNADGSGQRKLADGVSARARPSLTTFSWSPDSSRIAFVGGGLTSPRLTLSVIRVDGSGKRKLASARS